MESQVHIEKILFDEKSLAFRDSLGNRIMHGALYGISVAPFLYDSTELPFVIAEKFFLRYSEELIVEKQYGFFRVRSAYKNAAETIHLLTEILHREK
ncbi:MAG: hypothetical protein WC916_03235 [Candidatus Woesearchaeota archaeon]